jgi:uncharacterized iron-regulated membrane protein
MSRNWLTVHRWISLFLIVFWVLQAASGSILVFYRQVDDLLLAGQLESETDLELSRTIENVIKANSGTDVVRIIASGGHGPFFDVLHEKNGHSLLASRVDGSTGEVLRTTAWQDPISAASVGRIIFLFHKELLAGSIGHWFVGVSGLCLMISVLIALRIAWPRRRNLVTAVSPGPLRWTRGSIFRWHRAWGLWVAPLVIVMAVTGALQVWMEPIQRAMNARVEPPDVSLTAPSPKTARNLDQVVDLALREFPSGKISMIDMPSEARRYYRVRLALPHEGRRVFGTTAVYINATGTTVLKIHNAVDAPVRYRFTRGIYSVHTGEMFGIIGRLLSFLTGVALIVLSVFGACLWLRRIKNTSVARRKSNG